MKLIRDFEILVILVVIHGNLVAGEPLMGPFRCPEDAKCVEISSCSLGFYTTSDGRPYHCGPRDQMDSMICCVTPKSESVNTPNTSTQEGTLPQEDQNINDDHSSRSSVNSSDDYQQELALPDLPQDGINDDTTGFIMMFDDDDDDDLSRGPQPIMYRRRNGQDFDDISSNHNAHRQPSSHLQQDFNNFDNQIPSQGQQRREPRQSLYGENVCQCEKGDRGERGPPGEPGQTVYVYVSPPNSGVPNANGPYPSPVSPIPYPQQAYQQQPPPYQQQPQYQQQAQYQQQQQHQQYSQYQPQHPRMYQSYPNPISQQYPNNPQVEPYILSSIPSPNLTPNSIPIQSPEYYQSNQVERYARNTNRR